MSGFWAVSSVEPGFWDGRLSILPLILSLSKDERAQMSRRRKTVATPVVRRAHHERLLVPTTAKPTRLLLPLILSLSKDERARMLRRRKTVALPWFDRLTMSGFDVGAVFESANEAP